MEALKIFIGSIISLCVLFRAFNVSSLLDLLYFSGMDIGVILWAPVTLILFLLFLFTSAYTESKDWKFRKLSLHIFLIATLF